MLDEQLFTPWAQPGWDSWDTYSPERDFCLFAGQLQRMLQPATLLETGSGVGRLTRFLDVDSCTYLGFESDPAWRSDSAVPDAVTPSAEHMGAADMVILDSAPGYRPREIALWVSHGKPGSVCLVHDCGNGHPEGTLHTQLGRLVADTGFPGLMLRNPRGGWVGIHP